MSEGPLVSRNVALRLRYVAFGWQSLVGVVLIAVGGVLRWDESVYAARASDVASGSVASGPYWTDERAPGYPYVQSYVFRLFGESDTLARLTVLAMSVLLLWVAARILDEFFDESVGTMAVWLLVLCPGVMVTATAAMADLPSALFACGALYGLTLAWTRRNLMWLALFPVGVWVATSMRFGGAVVFAVPTGIVALGLLLELWRVRDRRGLVVSVGAFFVTAVGVFALLSTTVLTNERSPRGAKAAAVDVRAYPASRWLRDLQRVLDPGYVDLGFAGHFWNLTNVQAFGVLTAFGVVRCIKASRYVAMVVTVVGAVVPIVLVGWSAQVFVTSYLAPIFVNWAAGIAIMVAGGRPMLRARSGGVAALGEEPTSVGAQRNAWAFAMVVGIASFVGAMSLRAAHEHNVLARTFDPFVHASAASAELIGPDCVLWTMRIPQVTWYSDCVVQRLPDSDRPFPGDGHPAEDEWWEDYVATNWPTATSADPVSLLVIDGLGNWIPIESGMERADLRRSMLLTGNDGRRAAVITLQGGSD